MRSIISCIGAGIGLKKTVQRVSAYPARNRELVVVRVRQAQQR